MKRRTEFSKFALGSAVIAYFVVIALSGWAVVRCVLAQNYDSAAVIIGTTIGIVGTVTGVAYAFYSHKAKAENIVKIAQSLTKEEIDEVAELATSLGGMQ
jgi:membrane associated rhomboid family serine protease